MTERFFDPVLAGAYGSGETSEPRPSLGKVLARKDLSRSLTSAPAVSAIHRIQQTLASARGTGTFATRHTAGIDESFFDVVGVGAVALPLSHRTAQKLCEVARPARYGLPKKTLLDPQVRDTWEIAKRQIKLDMRYLQRTFDRKLELIARDLGCPTVRRCVPSCTTCSSTARASSSRPTRTPRKPMG